MLSPASISAAKCITPSKRRLAQRLFKQCPVGQIALHQLHAFGHGLPRSGRSCQTPSPHGLRQQKPRYACRRYTLLRRSLESSSFPSICYRYHKSTSVNHRPPTAMSCSTVATARDSAQSSRRDWNHCKRYAPCTNLFRGSCRLFSISCRAGRRMLAALASSLRDQRSIASTLRSLNHRSSLIAALVPAFPRTSVNIPPPSTRPLQGNLNHGKSHFAPTIPPRLNMQFAHFGVLNDGNQSKSSLFTSISLNVLLAFVVGRHRRRGEEDDR